MLLRVCWLRLRALIVICMLWTTAVAAIAAAEEPAADGEAPSQLSPTSSMNAAEIQLALQKLNVLGRVLYVAAHPDDENTALLAHWANGAHFDAAYLSITRGDGGQNLLGSDLREKLGVIRTQELLAALRIDHAQQFFTRANDFGFSKNPEETLRFWDREKMLADVVWVIRKFQPDVIVTRFSPEDRLTHGHHTASAQLTVEAFRAAADPARFPEQPAFAGPWQARRLLWNTSAFFAQARGQTFNPAGMLTEEIGGYNALLGRSYLEIAAASRSMHKSQGFGVAVARGARKEYFQLLDGEPAKTGVFDGIDTGWSRVGANGVAVAEKIRAALAAYRPADPAASVPALLEIRRALSALENQPWAERKRAELDAILAACLGLHLEAVAARPAAVPGQKLELKIEAIVRGGADAPPVRLRALRLPTTDENFAVGTDIGTRELFTKTLSPTLPESLPFSQPYWLREPGTTGTFAVSDQRLIGRPENPPALPVEATLEINGEAVRYTLEPHFRRTDPVDGEVRAPLVIAPPACTNFADAVFVFPDRESKRITVRTSATADAVRGQLALEAPPGWRVEPASIPIELAGANAEAVSTFTVTPPETLGQGTLRAVFTTTDGHKSSISRERITGYAHLGVQTLLPAAEAKLVRADIRHLGSGRVGYLPGAGDDIPASLAQIGYAVTTLNEADRNAVALARFDAVVVGVRAFNTREDIGSWLPELIAFAARGGVVLEQYNTTAELKSDRFGPYPFHLSRERVTDETAEMRFLAPEHPALNVPNQLSAADFEGWVQERGLYFPDTWDAAWTPLFSANDPGEKPLDGGLLVARVGEGYFVYTGLAFFRELPAGVPGAYRLFANLLSLGK